MKNKAENKKKIIILTVIAVMFTVGLVSWYLLYGNPDLLKKAGKEVKDDVVGMYGSNSNYIYYPIDDELDIFSVPEYLELDRSIHLTDGAETVGLEEEKLEDYDEDIKFFFTYFDYAINGKYNEYNGLFTENYFKTNEKTCDFTQQMIYDIYIEKLSDSKSSGVQSYVYSVSYKIYRNNGTLRNDIGSDGARILYFTLVEEDGKILIDCINY